MVHRPRRCSCRAGRWAARSARRCRSWPRGSEVVPLRRHLRVGDSGGAIAAVDGALHGSVAGNEDVDCHRLLVVPHDARGHACLPVSEVGGADVEVADEHVRNVEAAVEARGNGDRRGTAEDAPGLEHHLRVRHRVAAAVADDAGDRSDAEIADVRGDGLAGGHGGRRPAAPAPRAAGVDGVLPAVTTGNS